MPYSKKMNRTEFKIKLDFFNIWVFVRTSTKFAHLATFQAIEFVDWPVLKTLDILYVRQAKKKAFFTKRSILCCLRRTRSRFRSHPQIPRFPLGPPRTVPRTKNGLRYLTRASFTEAPVKTKSNLSVIFSSACYNLIQTYVFPFRALLIYLTLSQKIATISWLPIFWNYYLLSSFRITEKLHTFSFDCKLLVQENAHLKRKRQDVLSTQTLLSFELKLWHDRRLHKKHVLHLFICIRQRSCLQHRVPNMKNKWTSRRVRRIHR